MRRTILLILALVLVPAAVAHASATQVIRDCTDDEVLQGRYTQKELANALASLDADTTEYTNCAAVIRAAQLSGGSGSGGGGGAAPTPGTPTPPTTPGAPAAPPTGNSPGPFGGFSGYPANPLDDATPAERKVLVAAQAAPTGEAEQRATAVAANVLPAPLIIALALGAIGLLVLAALDLRRRVITRRAV